MNTFTYSAILIIVFFAGIFLFTYFETPGKTFKKGMKKIKDIQVLNLNKNNRTLTIPANNKKSPKNNDSSDFRVYVHEY